MQRRSVLSEIWLWIMLMVCAVLSLATLGVAAHRIGKTLPAGVDTFFIVQKDPSFQTQDGETKEVWKDNTSISIFQSSYQNGENQTVVLSQKCDDVVAPGAIMSYDFCICNDGNMAIAYELSFSFLFEMQNQQVDAGDFPLSIRLQRKDAEYVVGDENTWVEITSQSMGKYEGALGVNSYEHFILEIQWMFEGNDVMDTILGNMSAETPVSLCFETESYAETHKNPNAKGGIQVMDGEVGDTIRWDRYVWLIMAMLFTLLYVIKLL